MFQNSKKTKDQRLGSTQWGCPAPLTLGDALYPQLNRVTHTGPSLLWHPQASALRNPTTQSGSRTRSDRKRARRTTSPLGAAAPSAAERARAARAPRRRESARTTAATSLASSVSPDSIRWVTEVAAPAPPHDFRAAFAFSMSHF